MNALNAIAYDTGGRFLKNTNALDAALITTLNEISRYYLLAWSIDPEKLRPGKFSTIKASIKGRSGLSVRVRQDSLDLSKPVRDKNFMMHFLGGHGGCRFSEEVGYGTIHFSNLAKLVLGVPGQ